MLSTAILAGETIENAFILAMLLTGSIDEAETCVAQSSDCGLSYPPCPHGVFHQVIVRALHASSVAAPNVLRQDSSFTVLPWQLGCVLCLPLPQRRCFVLRILAGLSREVCAWLLHMHSNEVCQNTCAALDRIATLHHTLGIAGLAPSRHDMKMQPPEDS